MVWYLKIKNKVNDSPIDNVFKEMTFKTAQDKLGAATTKPKCVTLFSDIILHLSPIMELTQRILTFLLFFFKLEVNKQITDKTQTIFHS